MKENKEKERRGKKFDLFNRWAGRIAMKKRRRKILEEYKRAEV